LAEAIADLQSTSASIAVFFKMEANRFLAITGSGAKTVAKVAVDSDVAFWTAGKSDFDEYVKIMNTVTSKFNFKTDAKKPSVRELKYPQLDFIFHVPVTVPVDEKAE
jgi:hypothetical protein